MLVSLAFPPALALLLLLGAMVVVMSRLSRIYLPPARKRVALAIRLALLALITLALAQPRVALPQTSLNVIFLVDASDSVGSSGTDQAVAWIRQALNHLGPQDRAGVVVFGRDALVEQALSHSNQLPALTSAPVRNYTDIGGAIRLGMAMLAGQGGKRLILLSDGNENLGSAVDEARIAALSGVQISVVPVQRTPHPNVYVERVTAPNTLRKGEQFDITGNVQSSVAGQGTLYLFTDGALTSQQSITLHLGANAFDFQHPPAAQGFHTFSVHLETSADPTTENKQASTFGYVSGEPRVLLVEGQPGVGTDLQKALTSVGMQVDSTAPTGIPADLAQLRSYDSVILVNVPATALPTSMMQTLQLYVQNLGGGLVTIGGDKSYASGQYVGTPLDAMLPLSSQVKPRQNLPSTAVVFIIENLENSLGVDISKEAAKSAIGLLSANDEVAVNDITAPWAVPLQHVTDKAAIYSAIDAMNPGEPSGYATALTQSTQALLGSSVRTKHIILVGDGDAEASDQAAAESAVGAGITVSVIGTQDASEGISGLQFMTQLAQWGGGRYYDGNNPFDIPQLVMKETQLVARPAIVEEAFKPVVVGTSPVLRGIAPASLPPLLGYVATTAKPTAQQILVSSQQDPLLAQWQYGLGHVLSWTSDAGSRWAGNWVNWSQFAAFWSQVVRESLPSNVDQNLQVSVTPSAQGAHVTVDAIAADQTYRNFLKTQVTVVNPDATQSTVPLEQTAPGRYEGQFPTTSQGTYLLQIVQTDAQGRVVALQPAGYALDYSPEYRESGTNRTLLLQLAKLTQGQELNNPTQAFRRDGEQTADTLALWPWLLGAALLLFLVDVANRRLPLASALVALARRWSRHGGASRRAASIKPLFQALGRYRPAKQGARPSASLALAIRLARGAEDSPVRSSAESEMLGSFASRLQEQRRRRAGGVARDDSALHPGRETRAARVSRGDGMLVKTTAAEQRAAEAAAARSRLLRAKEQTRDTPPRPAGRS